MCDGSSMGLAIPKGISVGLGFVLRDASCGHGLNWRRGRDWNQCRLHYGGIHGRQLRCFDAST